MQRQIALLLLSIAAPLASAFSVLPHTRSCSNQRLWSERQDKQDDRMSFDEAGAGLIDEEDKKRMESMGDYDTNPNVRR